MHQQQDVPPDGPIVLPVLDAGALRRWCLAALEDLTAARAEIDDLNVYPVPDGDTGTNLQLTMASVVDALDALALTGQRDMMATVQAVVDGSLMGARGNSGVILSQLLRGLGTALAGLELAGPADLARALVAGATSAYDAVAEPVEGTVLTVARVAADAAVAALGSEASGPQAAAADLACVVRAARAAAAAALARTPEQLPVLAAAGVVDAGGRGWCVLLEALERVVTGAAPPPAPAMLVPRDRGAPAVAREAGSDAYAYEVQFLLRDADEAQVAALKGRLRALGDSLVVVGGATGAGSGGPGLWNVHVHVNDVGAALEAAVDAGRPFRITVSRFADQVAGAAEAAPARLTGRAVVAVAPGGGLARLFQDAGALVVEGGPTANPSTAELLAAVAASGAQEVVLLPNDRNVQAVAAAAAEQARAQGRTVAVVPTRSVLQGLAAASVAAPEQAFDDDVAAMGAAAGATRWAEVTTAVRAAHTPAGPCRPGDVLGLLEGEVAVVGDAVEQVARALLQRLLGDGGELVTVVVGAQADPDAGGLLASYLAGEHPTVEVQVLHGGQPHYPLLLAVE